MPAGDYICDGDGITTPDGEEIPIGTRVMESSKVHVRDPDEFLRKRRCIADDGVKRLQIMAGVQVIY